MSERNVFPPSRPSVWTRDASSDSPSVIPSSEPSSVASRDAVCRSPERFSAPRSRNAPDHQQSDQPSHRGRRQHPERSKPAQGQTLRTESSTICGPTQSRMQIKTWKLACLSRWSGTLPRPRRRTTAAAKNPCRPGQLAESVRRIGRR